MADRIGNVTHVTGEPGAEPGLDHPWFPYTPLPGRTAPQHSDGTSLALSVVVDLTAVEWEHPGSEPLVPPPGGRGVQAYPDLPRMSHREYGHRVGVFRLLRGLERIGIRPAVIMDVLTATAYPSLLDHVTGRVSEVVAGGLSASRAITSRMSVDEEAHYIGRTLELLEAAVGSRPQGWVGPQRGESTRTPALLAAAGVAWVGDWGNDDQPYPFQGDAAGLWSFPISWELSDLSTMHVRLASPSAYGDALRDAAQVLAAEGQQAARVLGVHLHPWISGQPFRVKAVVDALGSLQELEGVKVRPPTEVVRMFESAP